MKANQRLIKWIDKMKLYYAKSDHFMTFDWILFIILAGFCFISYAHADIIHTGNRSWILYDGIVDFYDNVAVWTQDNGANYMPSTFILFAVWNLPLKLLGVSGPEYISDFKTGLCIWYKILPLLFFAGSAWMIYRVAREIGIECHKAKIVMFAFMTMPICFFSQFIFSQYDIFTVFFMLWGLYYYYRNGERDTWRLALLFGVAVTFKYFAIVVFFVLLLVREKKVLNIIKYSVGVVLPFGVEYLIYQGSVGFRQGVFGFGVLNYVSNADFSSGLASFSYTKIGCVLMVLWAYFVHAKDKKEEIAWTLYLCCGVCFAIFGFCRWHPQWLMFMAPFWILSAFINIHLEKFLWIDTGFLIVFQLLCASVYKGNVDVNMMQFLTWKDVFYTKSPWYYISDILPDIDTNTTYSIFVAVLLVLFLFKHPKFTLDDFGERDKTDHMHLIRLRLVLVVLLFSVPAFIAAYVNTISQKTVLANEKTVEEWVELTEGKAVSQTLPDMNGMLRRVSFYSCTYDRDNTSTVTMELSDEEGKVIYAYKFQPEEICNHGYTIHDLKQEIPVNSDQSYTITLYSMDGTEDDCFGVGLAEESNVKEELICDINDRNIDCIAGIEYVLRYDGWEDAKENGR